MEKSVRYGRIQRSITHILLFFIIINSVAIHMPMLRVEASSQAADLVAKAKSQLGIQEKRSGSDDIFYNDWFYGRHVDNTMGFFPWCAVFVSWCANQAGISTNIIPKAENTTYMKNRLISLGGDSHLKGSGYIPKCGDIIFFGYDAGQHVGIVDHATSDRVYFIDGNNTETNPHGVHYSNRSMSDPNLWGFVTPNYSGAPPVPFTEDPKYNNVKGFKGYTLSTGKVELLEVNLSTRIGYIYATDECTVHELYTNGWCRVTCPWIGGGSRTGYARISDFIQSPTAAIGSYTANAYIDLYSKPNLATQIYRIYPNDKCLTIGSSGAAAQVFMPMSGKGYYELGWAKLPTIPIPPDPTPIITRYPTPFKCRILSNSNSAVNAYRKWNDSSSYLGHVYVNDDCMIQEVYTNGWCKFSCPFFGKVETVYGKFSDFSSANIQPYSLKAPRHAKTYYKSDKKTEVGWIDPGDAVTVIATSGSMSQIIYLADVGKRCGWVDSSALEEPYTVSYNANGGSGAPAAQTANRGTEITLSTAVPTRTGYTFAGWGDTSGNVLYVSGSKYSANADITLYAVWRQNEYEIRYDANGGDTAPEVQTQLHGKAVKAAEASGKMGQYIIVAEGIGENKGQNEITLERKFLSWNTKQDGTGTTVKAGADYMPNADVTLYAQYGKASFSASTLPQAPGRTGYTFAGWYDSKDGGNKIEAGKEISPELGSIYAHWTVNSYTVSYNANGGSGAPQSQTKVFGEVLKLSDIKPSRSGYTFKGWALTAAGREVAYESGSEYSENEAVTLYAVWDEDKAGLASISIAQQPAKRTYEFGEELNTAGLKLQLTYTSGNTEEVTSGYTVTGYDSRKDGEQTLTVTYGQKTATFTVTVKKQPVDEVAVVTIDDVVGAAPGEEVDVDIQLTKNPGFSFLMLRISYDKNALELVRAANKTSGNNLFMMNDTVMWDSAHDVSVGSMVREPMGTVTFRIKPDIALEEDGVAVCTVDISEVTCYNEEEKEVTVKSNKGTISVDSVNYGDVNGDGDINEKDVQALREYMATGKLPEGCDAKAADVNGDGRIWAEDIIRLNQYLEDPSSVKLGYDKNKAIGSGGEGAAMEALKFSVKNISEIRDGRFTVDVVLEENPGVAALSISADYDAGTMELVSVTNGTVIDGTLEQDAEEKGLLSWTTDKVSQGAGVLATLTFAVADNAQAGDYPVSAYVASCFDGSEKPYYGTAEAGQVTVPMGAVAAESVTLDQESLTLAGGDVTELIANVAPLDAADKTVIWTSSDQTVAAVSAGGQIRALKKGTAVITASVPGVSGNAGKASCTVTVTSNPSVLNFTLNEDPDRKKDEGGEKPPVKPPVTYRLGTETGSAKIAAGRKVKMKVTASNGGTLSNSKLKWKSKNTKAATVNSKGVVTLKKNAGGKKAVITGTLKSGSKSQLKYTIQCMKGAVKSIQITGKKTVKPGKTLTLKAAVKTTKGKANKTLKWKSSNTKLAKITVSGASAKVKTFKGKRGTVKITASATDGSGRKKSVKINIK